MNQNIQDASESYSQIFNAPHHSVSSQQSSSTSTLLIHQHLYKQRNDDDVLPPPPPEAYSYSENQHIYPSNTKINCSRREFLQTLNAKLSVFQNQRLSPKLVKRRSMSLPHSDQEWDSDSGITSQFTSSNKSSPRGSTSSHSESFSQSFTERLGTYESRNSNNSVCHKNQKQNTSDNSHSTYASFLYSEADVKNAPQNFGYSDTDNVNDHSLSKMNSSQHSEVAKAAVTEAIRRKKSQSECFLESNIRESNSQINLSQYNNQLHTSNPFHQNYASENMQTENVYTTRNQSVYQSTSNPTSAGFSESLPVVYQQKSLSKPAMNTLTKNCQIPIGHHLSSGNCSTGHNIDLLQKAANENQIIGDQVDRNAKSQYSLVPDESQRFQKNSGDISSCVDENNRAGSEGSITPTNLDRNSPTYESSKSTVLSYIKRDPVQLSALKSTKSYPGSHLAESLYSSTGTLSRFGKPAPPPPVRKTSSISDPNAITLGTLRSAGVSTYEEIKTLKRHSRNHSGGSSFNTYEELNSDKNAIYYAARKSCLSTSLTSLVEPIYSTLDSNSTGTAKCCDTKSVIVNSSGNQEKQDASKSFSQIYNAPHHSVSSQQSSSTSTLLIHQHLYKQRNDDDVLPPPPPEAYSYSENQHIYPSNTKINCSRREFLQTLNAKLSVFQNQRLSPKLVKRRSMSLPHSDQEWDSDSGITSQFTSSNKSSPRGSTSSRSESFAQSLVKRLTSYGNPNINSISINNGSQVDASRSRAHHGNSHSNTNNNSHAIYSSFFFRRNKTGESDSKNLPQDHEHGDVDDYSLSKIKMNSIQHSEVAKAAANEAIRRKKSQSESSLESNHEESNSQINPDSHHSSSMPASAHESSNSNCMDRIYRSHQHYLSHYNHQHHPSNPFDQNHASENMQTENVYTTRNQSVYQSTSNQPNAYLQRPYSGSRANHQQNIYSQKAMCTAPNIYLNNNGYKPPKESSNNTVSRSDIGSNVASSLVEESQRFQKNSGDISSCVDENNRAGSEGSITPTNLDRNSPTYESSKSTVLSYIKRDPVQLSALKSTKSYPGSHLAESLYSSTGTLSRFGKPAPPPPVRKTSSISDPNAITLGTLRSAGVSTYEEIKTLKRHSRNHSGGSSFNTYEELNSDKNAIYYAARKSCLSTSLTSLVEPIYSTLDSNSTGTAKCCDTKSVIVNSSGNQEKQDASKSFSQVQDPKQHPTSTVAFTVF